MRLIFVLLLFFSVSNYSRACLCHEFESNQEVMDMADFAAHVTIVDIQQISVYDTIHLEEKDSAYFAFADEEHRLIQEDTFFELTVEVREVFKGDMTLKNVTFYTATSSVACGALNFKVGQDYFIFGEQSIDLGNLDRFVGHDPFYTTKCSGNTSYRKEWAQQWRDLGK